MLAAPPRLLPGAHQRPGLQTTPFYVRHLDRAGVRRLLAVIASSPGFRHEMRDALVAYEETEFSAG